MTNHNPYQAPATSISPPEVLGPAGGTLEEGIAGNYDFEIKEVITEAWEKTNGAKGAVWGASLIVFLVVAGISFISAFILGLLGASSENQILTMLNEWLVTILMYPFLVGVMMLGIRRSVNLPINSAMAFSYWGYTLPILGAAIMIVTFTTIGFILLLIPGIYLSIAYLFALPLIVEKHLGPWQALESSRQAVTHHWFKVFLVFLTMWFIFSISSLIIIIPIGISLVILSRFENDILFSMISMGISLVWILPMMVNLNGILYRIIFGVEEARLQAKPPLVKIF